MIKQNETEIEKIMEKWHGKKEGKEYKIILN